MAIFKVSGKVLLCLFILVLSVSCKKVTDAPKDVVKSTRGTDREQILATMQDDLTPPAAAEVHGDPSTAEPAQPSYDCIFSESGTTVAYLAKKGEKYVVVKNNSKSRDYSAVGTVVLTPDGKHIAYPALAEGLWRMVVDGKEGMSYDGFLTPIFSPDGKHVMYQAKKGKKWFIVVDGVPNAGTEASYTTPIFSADSNRIAYCEALPPDAHLRLIVSDLAFGSQSVKPSIGDLLFTTNLKMTRIAAEQAVDKKLRVLQFDFSTPDRVHNGQLYEIIEKLVLSDDGDAVAYCAVKNGQRLVVMNNREESLPRGLLPEMPVIRPDNKVVGLLLDSQKKVSLHQFFSGTTDNGKKYDEASGLTYSRDSHHYVYAARNGDEWFVVVNGKEGPSFEKVVTPMFSPDGKHLVYRARKNGKRFVVVADTDGKTVKQHPEHEQVYQVNFTSDGKSVGYGVKDSNLLMWKVEKL